MKKKELFIDRRELLRRAAISYPALAYLAGCGGGGGGAVNSSSAITPITLATTTFMEPTADQQFECSASSICDPLAMRYDYSGQSLVPTKTPLTASLYNMTTAADRFNDGNLCYVFNGTTSVATVHGIANFPPIFAISFWAKSVSSAPMCPLSITDGTSILATIEVNNRFGLGVLWGELNSYALTVGTTGEFTDGLWHHFLVQFDGFKISAFVDGILQGSATTIGLSNATDLLIGGSNLPTWNGTLDDVRLHNRSFLPTYIPQMVYAWTQVKPCNRNDSLIAYYPFNGNAVNDNGRGFDGTLYNVTPTADRSGTAERAYAFGGNDSYIELPQNLGPIQTDFCLAFWFQSSSTAAVNAFSVTKGITPGSGDLNFAFNSGHALSVKLDGVSSTSISFGAPGELSDGLWHFVLFQRVGITFQLYVDGFEKGLMQNASALLTSDSIIRVGRGSGANLVPENFWTGALDDVQIYSTSFGLQEIADLMQLQVRPRDGAGALVFQNKMWLLGGWNPANTLPTNNEVWSSSDGSNWALVGKAPWERRHLAGWLVFSDRMWVIGGDNNSGHYQNDVWSSADGINWVEESTSAPWENRATQYTLVFNNLMWLMGGQQLGSDTTPGVAYNDVYSSVDGKSWSLVTSHAGWSPRGQIIGNVVFAGKMWVLGGGTYDVRTYLNDAWSSTDGVNWTQTTASAPWLGRQFQNVAVFDNKMWIVAGGTSQQEGGTSDVWYSTDGQAWTNLAGTPWIQRHAASIWFFQNALWFGNGSSAAVYNDVWKMTYAS